MKLPGWRRQSGGLGQIEQILGMAVKKRRMRWLLRHAGTGMPFFSLWTAFLERQYGKIPVDMEAWRGQG